MLYRDELDGVFLPHRDQTQVQFHSETTTLSSLIAFGTWIQTLVKDRFTVRLEVSLYHQKWQGQPFP